MSIDSIVRDWGTSPSIVRISASNTLTEVGTTGYLLAQLSNIEALNAGPFNWVDSDMALVKASDGWGFFTISSDFESLDAFSLSPSVIGPTVIGDFAVFASVDGNLEDLGYLPSDATKTRVVMANAAVIANHLAVYTDVNGTIADDAATAINAGNLQAGLSGTAGYLASFPATASRGSLRLVAANNAANDVVQITNRSHAQASVISIPDGGATSDMVLSPSALVNGNLVEASGTEGLVVDAGVAIGDVLLAALADGEVFVGSAGGVATGVAVSGDLTAVNTGAFTLGAVVAADKAEAYVPEAVIAGVPVLHVFNMAGGATATKTIATAQKITVVDAWVVLKAAGSANDTIQVKNAAGTAITDAMDVNDSDNVISRAATIDDSTRVVAAGANLQCTETDGGGNDSPACDVYVLCYVTP